MDLVLAPFFEHIAQWWQQINKLLEEKNISMYEEKERGKNPSCHLLLLQKHTYVGPKKIVFHSKLPSHK